MRNSALSRSTRHGSSNHGDSNELARNFGRNLNLVGQENIARPALIGGRRVSRNQSRERLKALQSRELRNSRESIDHRRMPRERIPRRASREAFAERRPSRDFGQFD